MLQPDVRLVAPFVVAFVVSMLLGPIIIGMLKRCKAGQTISEDGPESHRPKAGTPTMGGLIIIAGILAGVLAAFHAYMLGPIIRMATPWTPTYLPSALALMLLYAVVGGADDYLTIHPIKGVRGIASKPKAAIQILLATAFVAWLATHSDFTPVLYVAQEPIFGGLLYWVFAVVFIVGMANFVNITDGLDGLATGLTSIACVAMAFCMVGLVTAISHGMSAVGHGRRMSRLLMV